MAFAKVVAAAILVIEGENRHTDYITKRILDTKKWTECHLGDSGSTPKDSIRSTLSTSKELFKQLGNNVYEATEKAKNDTDVLEIVEALNLNDVTTYGIVEELIFQKSFLWDKKTKELLATQEEFKERVVQAVRSFYWEKEWKAQLLEKKEIEKFGFDLRCVKGLDKKSVIVKILNPNENNLVITADEIMRSLVNPDIVIHLVTLPTNDKVKHFPYSGREFVNKFKLEQCPYKQSTDGSTKYIATNLDEI